MPDFIQEYFIDPIMQNGWFNPVNTIAYGLILVAAVYLVYRLLARMNIKIDSRFFIAILPFIFWGSSTRVLHDSAVAAALSTPELIAFYSSKIFPTPGSYIITFSIAIAVLLLSLAIQKISGNKISYWKFMFCAGIFLDILNVLILPVRGFNPLYIIISLTILWSGLFFLVGYAGKLLKLNRLAEFFNTENLGIFSAHFLDASATFVALSFFGYVEQHVVPNLFFPLIGPISMFFLKIAVLLPVLYIIDRYEKPGSFRSFLKIVIFILGLAPGLRDLLRLMAGV
jgi:uncharacterized membrane protein